MNVTLKPEFEEYVEEQIRTGRFSSPAEVLEAGLTQMMTEMDFGLDDEDLAAIEMAEKEIADGNVFTLAEVRAEFEKDILEKK